MLGLAGAARGMAVVPTLQRRLVHSSRAAAAQHSGLGCSRLRAVARMRSAVAAAGSNGSQAAIEAGTAPAKPAAWQALCALPAAWIWPAAQAMRLGVVAAAVAAFCKVFDNSAKQEFEEMCQDEQPAAVAAALRRQSQKLGRRLYLHASFIGVVYVLWAALTFSVAGTAPWYGVAEKWPQIVVQMWISSIALIDAAKALWVFCMARHGAASGGGQQPCTP